jgi:hypothetical protein
MPAMAPEMVVDSMDENGSYWAHAVNKDGAKPIEFSPLPANHIYLQPLTFYGGDHVIYREGLNWVDATVKALPSYENGWIPLVRANFSSGLGSGVRASYSNDSPHFSESTSISNMDSINVASSVKSGKEMESNEENPTVLRHLTVRNSGCARLSAGQFDEEVNRLKVFYKARHSAVIDALSGARLNVRECAMPTLQVVISEGTLEDKVTVNRFSETGSLRQISPQISAEEAKPAQNVDQKKQEEYEQEDNGPDECWGS